MGPLGSLSLDTHDGVFGLVVDTREIRVEKAREFINRPATLSGIDEEVARDAAGALRTVVLRAIAGAVVGGVAVAALRRVTRRRLLEAAAIAVGVMALSAAIAGVTWNRDALAAPRYTGLLTIAPQAVGSLDAVQERFEEYSAQLSSLVGNLATIYDTAATLPVINRDDDGGVVRLLHVSDLHLNPAGFDLVAQLVKQFEVAAVIDSGDINDWGTPLEARLVSPIASLGVPYIYVRGNHDSGATAAAVAAQPNARVLDDNVTEVEGIRIWGIGDPRFTPDKSEAVPIEEEQARATAFAPEVARRADRAAPIDIAVLHDPRAAARLGGVVPLILAGHLHAQSSRELDSSLMLIEGSTGGAGLRGLEGDTPEPLTATVLHVSRSDQRLRAFDRIVVSGLGRTGARIQRYLVPAPEDEAAGRAAA